MPYTKQEKLQIADNIVNQLGGMRKLRLMIGAYGFVALDKPTGVMFSFKGSRKFNKCIIEYRYDTYTFILGQYSKKHLEYTEKYRLEGVYNNMLMDLFESETGLYLTLHRRR